jgi:hypothetical protein
MSVQGSRGPNWTIGYTQGELDTAQDRYALTFPPDLIELLMDRRLADSFDWRTDHEIVRDRLDWPLEGLWFDVQYSGLWWPEWGAKPAGADDQKAVLRNIVERAPKLIPIFSHRYLPEEPHEAGNPVLSVYQADVIYYGANLMDYIDREFIDPHRPMQGDIKRIRFWSDMIDRAYRKPWFDVPPAKPWRRER